MAGDDINKLIKKKSLSPRESLEFFEELAKEVRGRYGTDDPDELKKLAEESDDLWLEDHVHDLEIYQALKKYVEASK